MDKIKKMWCNLSLRKSIILYISAFVILAILLSAGTATLCNNATKTIESKYPPTGEKYYLTNENGERLGDGNYIGVAPVAMSEKDQRLLSICEVAPIIATPIYSALCIITATLLFYRNKLKKPLTELKAASEMISNNNLNFSIKYDSKDELGELCSSFETMRFTLANNFSEMWRQMEERKQLNAAFAHDLRTPLKYYVVKQLREHGYTIFAYGDSKIDLYMLREADKGFLYIGKRISRSLKNESLSGLVPIYDHSLVILADEDEEVQADIAICKSNSGISGSRLAAAHVRLGEKIGRHIATVFPEKNTSILVLERGGRFFGDGVYMGAGGIFYSMNPKQDDAPVINTERVVIVDSVINTGKSIMRIIDELKNHNPGIDVIIAANVIQNEAAELFKDYLVFATRLSKNSFVGVNQSKQTGKTGPDTADRLFNLIKKRY